MQTQTQIREPKTQKIAINKKSIEAKSYFDDVHIYQAKSEKTTLCSSFSMSIWISGAGDDWKSFLIVSPARGEVERRNRRRMMEEHHGF